MSEDHPVATNTLWKDSYIAYIPLLGAAVALTYDVGCFNAIGISFFTLFSLSEHIVFAIQAFPAALAVLIAISGVTLIVAMGGLSDLFFISEPYKRLVTLGSVLAILLVTFAFGLAAGTSYISKDYGPLGIIPPASNVVHLKNSSSPIIGRIIRSGDRGVLLYDRASDQTRFILWDTIESIEATPQRQ